MFGANFLNSQRLRENIWSCLSSLRSLAGDSFDEGKCTSLRPLADHSVLGPLVNVRAVPVSSCWCHLEKKMYNLETRGLFYLMYKNDDLSLPCSLSALRDHSKEIRQEPGNIGVFVTKVRWLELQKIPVN